jgi:hypothetical protein
MKLTALALLGSAALVAASKNVKLFEDVKGEVEHVVHKPKIRATSRLDRDVDPSDLAVQLTLPVGNGRTATVHARPSTKLVPAGYVETVMYGNGTQVDQPFPESQRRCYWNGPVTFSDGTDGHMAFTSCHRGSSSHAEYLVETGQANHAELDERASDTPFHYVSGVILDYATGQTLAVEPTDFENYKVGSERRRSLRKAAPPKLADDIHEEEDEDEGDLSLGDHYTYDSTAAVKASGRDTECGNEVHPREFEVLSPHHHPEQHDDAEVARRLLQSNFARQQRKLAVTAPVRCAFAFDSFTDHRHSQINTVGCGLLRRVKLRGTYSCTCLCACMQVPQDASDQ